MRSHHTTHAKRLPSLYFTIKEQSSITKYANIAAKWKKREKVSEKERMAKLRSEKEMKKVNHKRKNESNLDISHKAFYFGTTLFRIVNNAQFLYMPFFCWYLQKKQDFFSRIFFLILFFLSSLSLLFFGERDEGNISSVMKGLLSIS